MTQKDKELLLKDLCSRLPYGVKIAIPGLWDREISVEPLNEIFKGDDDLFRVNGNGHCIEYIKPYLLPLSSMTDEQRDIVDLIASSSNTVLSDVVVVDFYNKKHFDYRYRGLIPMGLAFDVTGLNIY